VHAVFAAVAAFFVGSVPFSQIAARIRAGADLRRVGSGTVSGTNLFRVAGFGPLAVAGVFEVAKGGFGPVIAGDRPLLAAVCGGLAVAGHNWSPFLRGAGGRGISPALGAMLVQAWPGAVVLILGLVLGRFLGETALGSFVADTLVVPVTALTHGAVGAWAAVCVVVPMLVKRVLGNERPAHPDRRTYLHRLLYDHDPAVPEDRR
jgi:glycerol-3-phosphate acyltransferase PlsY